MFISKKHKKKQAGKKTSMSQDGDTFWVSLTERIFGLIIIIIGGVMLYFTATTLLGGFGAFFGVLAVFLLILGIFLLIVKPPE